MATLIRAYSGFTETTRVSTGTEATRAAVLARFGCHDLEFPWPAPWKADTEADAAMIARLRPDRIVLMGYSHGSYAAIRCAKELAKHGRSVALMLLCDPVYRPTWLPPWTIAQVLSVRSLLPGSAKVTIPANVRRVASVYQRLNIPRGHDLKAADPGRTIIAQSRQLIYGHSQIDDSPEWQSLVIHELEQLLKP